MAAWLFALQKLGLLGQTSFQVAFLSDGVFCAPVAASLCSTGNQIGQAVAQLQRIADYTQIRIGKAGVFQNQPAVGA